MQYPEGTSLTADPNDSLPNSRTYDVEGTVFQPTTTNGDLTVETLAPSADCKDTTSGANPSYTTINGVSFIIYNLDKVLSGAYPPYVTAREYCVVHNNVEYKLISKLPYVGASPYSQGSTSVNVEQDPVLGQMINSFKFTN